MTVATFNDNAPAEALKDRLLAAGLRAEVLDESGTQAIFFATTNPKAHMRVRVRKEEYPRALDLIKEWDAKDSVMREAVRCPNCGSSRVEYPQFSRRTGMTFFFGLLAAMHIIPREYYCEDCQNEWPDKEPVKPNLDVLNWPKSGAKS